MRHDLRPANEFISEASCRVDIVRLALAALNPVTCKPSSEVARDNAT